VHFASLLSAEQRLVTDKSGTSVKLQNEISIGEVATATTPAVPHGTPALSLDKKLNGHRIALPDFGLALSSITSLRGCTQPGRRWFPHPFPARMPPEVADHLIENFTLRGQVVLDPMSGSGVVPFAAQKSGRIGYGRDIEPLAVLLGRSLCADVDAVALRAYTTDIHRKASVVADRRKKATCYIRRLSKEDKAFLRYWFPHRSLLEMFALAEVILADTKHPLSGVAAAILSSLVITRETGVSLARDLSRSRPHKVASKTPKSPFKFWKEKAEAFAKFYERMSGPKTHGTTDINLGDARQLEFDADFFDAIVTSPPYVNAIDYFRTSKFTLIFLGCKLAALRQMRASAIGTEVGLPKGRLAPRLDELIDRGVRRKDRRPMLRRYIFDLRSLLLEAIRILKPGGVALYVLGPSIASRSKYDSVNIFSTLAEDVGFEVIGDAKRELSAANRSLPPPNRSRRRDSINRRMTCEFYIALRKPMK
jgi:DNA modification methylase